jgi:4-hydroxy-2-oxoglutarate aldolase
MSSAKITTAKAKPLPPGVYTPVITLYDDTPEQGVNLEAMYKHCQYLVNAGCHGVVYLGTNGELPMLDADERVAVIKNARKAVTDLGIADYPILAGITAQSTAETIKNAKAAAAGGAGWGLLLPPSYWNKAVNTDVLVGFYRDVADASPIPIVIYNFPGVTQGVDIDSDQLCALASHPNIVAAKLTCANVGKGIRVTAKYGPEHMSIFGGSADYLIPGLSMGSSGCVVGMGNVFPKSVSRLYDYYKAGKIEEATALQEKVAAAEWACKKGIACTKYAAYYHIGRQIGLDNESFFHMRKPYLPLNDGLKKWTLEVLSILEETEKTMPGREAIVS